MLMLIKFFKLYFVIILSSIIAITEVQASGQKEVSMEVNISNSSVNTTVNEIVVVLLKNLFYFIICEYIIKMIITN